MIGPDGNAVATGLQVVGAVVGVLDAGAFGRLDEHERHGVVHTTHGVLLVAAKMGHAQLVPVYGVLLTAFAVLVAGDVDAIDALAGVLDALAQIAVVLPFAYTDGRVGRYRETEAVASVVLPHALIVDVAIGQIVAVTAGHAAAKVARVDTG